MEESFSSISGKEIQNVLEFLPLVRDRFNGITAELHKEGNVVSRSYVARLMKKYGIRSKVNTNDDDGRYCNLKYK